MSSERVAKVRVAGLLDAAQSSASPMGVVVASLPAAQRWFEIHTGFVAACAGVALAVAVVASIVAARSAARLEIISALRAT